MISTGCVASAPNCNWARRPRCLRPTVTACSPGPPRPWMTSWPQSHRGQHQGYQFEPWHHGQSGHFHIEPPKGQFRRQQWHHGHGLSAGNDGLSSPASAREVDDPGRAAMALTVAAANDINQLTDYSSQRICIAKHDTGGRRKITSRTSWRRAVQVIILPSCRG